MADGRLVAGTLRAGIWQGVIAAPGGSAPLLEAWHGERVLPGLEVSTLPDRPGEWALRLPVPSEILSDGVQTIVVQDAGADGQALARIVILCGQALDEDLRAEIDLLRAELDLLKRAFRRHCLETIE